jgi:hypothetical protein
MSFDALLKEVESLADEERRRLLAFMVAMEDRASAGYAEKLARKLDAPSTEHWLTPEECSRELGLPGPVR